MVLVYRPALRLVIARRGFPAKGSGLSTGAFIFVSITSAVPNRATHPKVVDDKPGNSHAIARRGFPA